MKIKTWLLITYLLVMLLPLAALYGLYVSIDQYYQDRNGQEYFEKWHALSQLKTELDDPQLYEDETYAQKVVQFVNEQTMITLYKPNGKIIYTSNPLLRQSNYENLEILYEDLYKLHQNYSTYIYKEPIYDEGKIVGIYKILFARTDWTEQVNNKTKLMIGGLVTFLLLLYGGVIYFLNRRLHQPLQQLMQQMHAFAKGEETKPLRIHNDEIGELAESFEQMQQEIRDNRAKIEHEQQQKEFMIASLSHDLKTPLTSIQAYAEGLQSGKLSQDEQYDYIRTVQTKADYMKQLLDDLMMFTLLQSPTYTLELVTVEGEEFFDMLLGDYEQVSIEKGFTASTKIRVTKNYAVNPKQLMRALDNLVANAWTYTNPNGSIYLAAFEGAHKPDWCIASIQPKATGIYIVVQNSGTTLTAAQCQQLFEPLYQVDEARSHIGQRGAGLGLSITKQIIEKHNGTIEVVSNKNETAMIIWLPEEEQS